VTEQPAVVARGLSKRYGTFEAVAGIDFEAAARSCYGFLGPNGAGKTTTMRMIACSQPPTHGQLDVLGLPVRGNARRIKDRLGIVPQEDNLDEQITVLENLVVYARYFGIKAAKVMPRVDELLAFMQLEDKRERRITELSGGMKRRLMIARGLLNDPEMLILDEPTTGLDPQARHLVWEKLRTLRRQGVTLILTTHYMEEAAQLCDRLVIMHEGKILVEGRPRDLVAAHASRQVVEVFDPPVEVEKDLDQLSHFAERSERLADRWLFHTEDGDALLGKVRALPLDAGAVWLRGGTLEDVFLSLTGRRLVE
jgi:lipooligosaccharide transport system ATP-binding protein